MASTRRHAALALTFLLLAALAAAWVPHAGAATAIVAQRDKGKVAFFDTSTGALRGTTSPVGGEPFAIAVTPDGARAYVANLKTNNVSVLDVASAAPVAEPIQVGKSPDGVAIAPDGAHVYVANNLSESVSVINTASNLVEGEIKVGKRPEGIAITPDGNRIYVANGDDGTVSVINAATRQVEGLPLPVGTFPSGIAITPDGTRAYVVNNGSKTVSVIELSSNTVLPNPILVGQEPFAIAITPDGTRAYVTSLGKGGIAVIDTLANSLLTTNPQEKGAPGVAFAPDGSRAFVVSSLVGGVQAFDTATNQPAGPAIPSGPDSWPIAIVPDQSPRASFAVAARRLRPGVPVRLDASATKDADGTVASYSWDFGGGQTTTGTEAVTTHTFPAPGTYKVTLSATDNEGCSHPVFTGQTASCNGGPASQTVTVAYPGVKLSCPRRARSACNFTVQAIARKTRRGHSAKAETTRVRVRVRRGRSSVVSLKPKSAFAAKLATADKILVKLTRRTRGSARTTYPRLKVVQ